MCRFLVYKGDPLVLGDVVTRPEHSILRQSYGSRERQEATALPGHLNADGFGVGWYAKEEEPCVFVSTLPAWNNRNLTRLCDSVASSLVFAHIRAASLGSSISEDNCHPFVHGKYLFMHNGNISDFDKIKRKLLHKLSDRAFASIQGNTDSSHAFALFLDNIIRMGHSLSDQISSKDILLAMKNTLYDINSICKESNITGVSFLNFAVTDGRTVVISRVVDISEGYSNEQLEMQSKAASLYFSSGTAFKSYGGGVYRMAQRDKREGVIIVASERITHVDEDWMEVPENFIVVINEDNDVLLEPFEFNQVDVGEIS